MPEGERMELSQSLEGFKIKLKIMRFFVETGDWATRYAVSKGTGIELNRIKTHMNQLVESGLLEKEERNGKNFYLLKPFTTLCIDGMVFLRINREEPSKENLIVQDCPYYDECEAETCYGEDCKLKEDIPIEKLSRMYRVVEEVQDEIEEGEKDATSGE